ncbi:hypothetical protein B0H13DRAFT_1858957 [Mycena leptocephala]|nr:hypothetical protein B0H13DRAFT_1858957 [Mycena leptocephala]
MEDGSGKDRRGTPPQAAAAAAGGASTALRCLLLAVLTADVPDVAVVLNVLLGKRSKTLCSMDLGVPVGGNCSECVWLAAETDPVRKLALEAENQYGASFTPTAAPRALEIDVSNPMARAWDCND